MDRTIKRHPEHANCPTIRSIALLSWGTHLSDERTTAAILPASLNRNFPDQTDLPQHITLWDGSNYKTAY